MRHIFGILLRLGAVGLVGLSILDSSFLFVPVGNDMLLAYLVARSRHQYVFLVLCAALGSTLGVLILDSLCRKLGEEGLKRITSEKRFKSLKRRMEHRAAFMVGIACLAPPPFPFTAFIAAASAFQYSRRRLLAVVFGARTLRFSLVGLAALRWGPGILRVTRTPGFLWFMAGFAAMCVIGSVLSVLRWNKLRPRAAV